MKRKVLGVAFDMDGLIFDTEGLYKHAWQKAGKKVGYPIDDELYKTFIGIPNDQCEQVLLQKFGSEFPLQKFRQEWQRSHVATLERDGIAIKPGFEQLLRFLTQKSLPLAVATSSLRQELKWNFKNTTYLIRFSTIVTREDLHHGKPDPEIYLLVAKKMGIRPENLLTLEDSNNGMRAAIAAGTIAVMIPDILPPDEDIKKNAFAIVNSLQDVIDLSVWYELKG